MATNAMDNIPGQTRVRGPQVEQPVSYRQQQPPPMHATQQHQSLNRDLTQFVWDRGQHYADFDETTQYHLIQHHSSQVNNPSHWQQHSSRHHSVSTRNLQEGPVDTCGQLSRGHPQRFRDNHYRDPLDLHKPRDNNVQVPRETRELRHIMHADPHDMRGYPNDRLYSDDSIPVQGPVPQRPSTARRRESFPSPLPQSAPLPRRQTTPLHMSSSSHPSQAPSVHHNSHGHGPDLGNGSGSQSHPSLRHRTSSPPTADYGGLVGLATQLDQMMGMLASMNAEISSVKSTANAIKSEVGVLKSSLMNVKGEFGQMKAHFAMLKNDVGDGFRSLQDEMVGMRSDMGEMGRDGERLSRGLCELRGELKQHPPGSATVAHGAGAMTSAGGHRPHLDSPTKAPTPISPKSFDSSHAHGHGVHPGRMSEFNPLKGDLDEIRIQFKGFRDDLGEIKAVASELKEDLDDLSNDVGNSHKAIAAEVRVLHSVVRRAGDKVAELKQVVRREDDGRVHRALSEAEGCADADKTDSAPVSQTGGRRARSTQDDSQSPRQTKRRRQSGVEPNRGPSGVKREQNSPVLATGSGTNAHPMPHQKGFSMSDVPNLLWGRRSQLDCLSLRVLNREWRDKVDAELFQHLVLERDTVDGGDRIVSLSGGLPLSFAGEDCTKRLGYVRVIDVHYGVSETTTLPWLASAIGTKGRLVDIFRVFADDDGHHPLSPNVAARTFIAFPSPAAYLDPPGTRNPFNDNEHFDNDGYMPPGTLHAIQMVTLPMDGRRPVTFSHVDLAIGMQDEAWLFTDAQPNGAKVHNYKTDLLEDSDGHEANDGFGPLMSYHKLVNAAVERLVRKPRIKLTLVDYNTTYVDPVFLGLFGTYTTHRKEQARAKSVISSQDVLEEAQIGVAEEPSSAPVDEGPDGGADCGLREGDEQEVDMDIESEFLSRSRARSLVSNRNVSGEGGMGSGGPDSPIDVDRLAVGDEEMCEQQEPVKRTGSEFGVKEELVSHEPEKALEPNSSDGEGGEANDDHDNQADNKADNGHHAQGAEGSPNASPRDDPDHQEDEVGKLKGSPLALGRSETLEQRLRHDVKEKLRTEHSYNAQALGHAMKALHFVSRHVFEKGLESGVKEGLEMPEKVRDMFEAYHKS